MSDANAIDRTADELAIRNTLAELARQGDSKSMDDIGAYVDCFTADAVWEMPGEVRTGRDDIRAGLEARRSNASPDLSTVHFVATTVVSFDDDDNAQVESYIQAFRVVKGESPAIALLGRYHDRFRRTPDGWKLHRRLIELA